jgi:hypothetical protein
MSKAKPAEKAENEEKPAVQVALRAFLEDWQKDTPAEAAGGSFAPTARDRWAEKSFEGTVPDGVLFADGWFFVFGGGSFVQATRFVPQETPFFVESAAMIGLPDAA